jgi:hypothetical protein
MLFRFFGSTVLIGGLTASSPEANACITQGRRLQP